jgi:hypothetical protein
MRNDPKTEIGRAIRDAGRIPGWTFRPAAIQKFQVGNCEVIVVPVRIFADNRKRLLANVCRFERRAPGDNAA